MRRYLMMCGLLAVMTGCHSAYKEFEPHDRAALLSAQGNPPQATTPSWTQTHSQAGSPLAYRSPAVAGQASASFSPNGAARPPLNRPFQPGPAVASAPVDKGHETAKPSEPTRLTPLTQVGLKSPEDKGTVSPQTKEPPMATGAPRQFPNLVEPLKPIASPVEKEVKPASDKGISSPAVRMVNSKRISLNYELRDVGPSGISSVDLYVTRDGKEWLKDDKALRSGPPYVFEVENEGMYGFTLVARSGLGLGKTPPKAGEAPQVWVEVDLTRPEVRLQDVKHGLGVKAREVTIQWAAGDRNLSRRPVTLSYAEKPEGPWTPIAANIENTGNYVWLSPATGPTQFFVRVEAVDLVGNIGLAQTSKPLLIDMSQPTVSILTVEPATK